jgi:hypothetical protein
MANSSMLVFPTSTMPAAASCSTTNALYGATKSCSMREPQVVRKPPVMMTSLCAIGMPVRMPASPRARRASASRAATRARSPSIVRKAFRRGLARAMRSSKPSTSSTLDKRPAPSACESSVSGAVIIGGEIETRGFAVATSQRGRRSTRALALARSAARLPHSMTLGTRYRPSSTAGAPC